MNAIGFPALQEAGTQITEAPHVILGLDYDGTLTPIVEEPSQAFLSTAMREVLWNLAARPDVTLAFISGRRVRDLQERVGIAGAIYAGNHGLEIIGPDMEFVEPAAVACAPGLKAVAAQLTHQLANIAGVFVEDKNLTLSVHYRKVAPVDWDTVWQTVLTTVASAKQRTDVTIGDKVYEVRPHLRWNKGTAIQWIKKKVDQPNAAVIYLGDDVTDEDAFSALQGAVTVKIGDSAETAAQYLLASPQVVQHFLEWVHQLLCEKPCP